MLTHCSAPAALLPAKAWRGPGMRRDMELVRKIFEQIQARKDVQPKAVTIEGYDNVTVEAHMEMLYAEGMIQGIRSQRIGNSYDPFLVTDMSWSGHDLIGLMQMDGIWEQFKSKLSPAKLAGMSTKMVLELGTKFATKIIAGQLGIDG